MLETEHLEPKPLIDQLKPLIDAAKNVSGFLQDEEVPDTSGLADVIQLYKKQRMLSKDRQDIQKLKWAVATCETIITAHAVTAM